MTDNLWQFEAADPSVGIFGDLIIHNCSDADDHPEAAEVYTRMEDKGDKIVRETTTYQCPACKATTEVVTDIPRWYLTDDERDNE